MNQILKQIIGPPPVHLVDGSRGDILVFSMRRVADLVANCLQYEFEDVIVDVAGADRVEPARLELVEFERRVYKALYKATSSPSLALKVAPKLGGLRLGKKYELFLAIFNDIHEVYALSAIPDWREQSRRAVCVIVEAYEEKLPEYLLKSLAGFDRVYLSSNPVEAVSRIMGRACQYLPFGIDAIGFCPYPNPPQRSIDILGIGRRSPVTHAALMALARERGLFYYYDTVRATVGITDAAQQVTFSVMNAAEHRFKLANLLKRSRYFIANRARANEARLALADELSGRFFEGAAAGAIMIGEPPASGPFLSLFDWPDAVVKAPFDAPNIGEVLAELEADPERSARIRRDNLVNALSRHDCAYRLRTILEDCDMPLPPGLLAREARLRELADLVRGTRVLP